MDEKSLEVVSMFVDACFHDWYCDLTHFPQRCIEILAEEYTFLGIWLVDGLDSFGRK